MKRTAAPISGSEKWNTHRMGPLAINLIFEDWDSWNGEGSLSYHLYLFLMPAHCRFCLPGIGMLLVILWIVPEILLETRHISWWGLWPHWLDVSMANLPFPWTQSPPCSKMAQFLFFDHSLKIHHSQYLNRRKGVFFSSFFPPNINSCAHENISPPLLFQVLNSTAGFLSPPVLL